MGKPLPKAFHDALGATSSAAAPAALDDLSPTAPRKAVFRLYEGGEALDAGEARARLTRAIERNSDGREMRITRIRTNPDHNAGKIEMASTLVPSEGGWAMTRSETTSRGVITEYDPSMLVYPASLAPGEPITQEVRLTVRPIDDPQRVQNRGVATNTIELLGNQTVRTALGVVEALRVRATFVGTFGVARVRRVTDTWHAPDIGLVAEEVHERVTALGAPVSAIDQALLLIAVEEAAQLASEEASPADSSARSTSESDNSQ